MTALKSETWMRLADSGQTLQVSFTPDVANNVVALPYNSLLALLLAAGFTRTSS